MNTQVKSILKGLIFGLAAMFIVAMLLSDFFPKIKLLEDASVLGPMVNRYSSFLGTCGLFLWLTGIGGGMGMSARIIWFLMRRGQQNAEDVSGLIVANILSSVGLLLFVWYLFSYLKILKT